MIKIQVGEIFMNKTKRFLAPCLNEYGETFIGHINSVFKVAIGIGDMLLIQKKLSYEQHIFILIDTATAKEHFKKFIKWFRNQDMHEDDYAYDDIRTGRYHMVVIKLPESCYKPAQLLRQSQFSKMFTVEQINKYFKNRDERLILIKDSNYRITYAHKLNDLFEATVKPEDIEGELEFPLRKEDEIFSILTSNKKSS
jgi:hypothetical protein